MNIITSYLTKSVYYKQPRTIIPKGIVLHSVGCPQPSAKVFVHNWNSASYTRASIHGFIDANTGDFYNTLPWTYRAPHCGGSLNNTHIGVEMCEPNCIKYTSGANFTCSNLTSAREMVTRTYLTAVELFAYLCKEFKLDPLADGVILSHSEAHARGLASNHADPVHLWKGLDLEFTMDGFRKDVKAKIEANSNESEILPEIDDNGNDINVENNTGLYKVQIGAFSNKVNAQKLNDSVKAAGFSTYMTKIGDYWKVQVGAFSKKSNAENMLNKLKNAGFEDAFITYIDNREVVQSDISVGDKVKVINPVTYNGKSFKVYYDKYDVIQVDGDRVVIGIGKTVAGAFKKDDLEEVF